MKKGELLSIETSEFLLSIIGPIPNKKSFALKNFNGGNLKELSHRKDIINIQHKEESLEVPLLKVTSKINKYSANNTEIVTSSFDNESDTYLPLFFENIDYHVQLSSNNTKPSNKSLKYTLWHEHSSINKNLSYFEKHNTFSGTINFRNNVGVTKFEIRENNRPILDIEFAVFSIKIDFLKDRYYMIEEISNVHNKLIFKLFKPTRTRGTTGKKKASGVEWLTNFYHYSNDLIKTFKAIERKAHDKINIEKDNIKIEKIKKPNKYLSKQINKYGKNKIIEQITTEIHIKRNNYNTDENKYIKYLATLVSKELNSWINYIKQSDIRSIASIKKEVHFKLINGNRRKLNRLLRNEFWSNIDDNFRNLTNKNNFLFHSEFVRFEKICRTIRRAIDLQVEGLDYVYTMSMEDMYELWTFLKLAQIISVISFNDEDKIYIKVNEDAFRSVIKTGQASKVSVGNDVFIAINRLFTTNIKSAYFSPLVNQKPDIIFELESKKYLNIFDAKYKIDVILLRDGEPKALSNRELISIDLTVEDYYYKPKDTDINTIHRYRDAILTEREEENEDSIVRATNKGIILYPHKPSIKEDLVFREYLEKLEAYKIGAIPLAPGKKDLKWYEDDNYLKDIIPDNYLETEQLRILANQLKTMLDNI